MADRAPITDEIRKQSIQSVKWGFTMAEGVENYGRKEKNINLVRKIGHYDD
jgi:hypothetical protein